MSATTFKKDFPAELEKRKALIWPIVQKYLPDKFPFEHYQMVREYPLRQGKYLRGSLVLLAAELYGGKTSEALLTAAAMQVSEDWLLIHDDFEDHSEERRSTKTERKLTLSKMYNDELAVNAGDALHLIMWRMLGDNIVQLGLDRGLLIYRLFNDVLVITTEGQYLELNWIYKSIVDLKITDYFEMVKRKTVGYTVLYPLQLGALAAGVTQAEKLAKIAQWAEPFGCAFQIEDDVMNLRSATKIQGKEWAGDIWEGKRTLILIHLLEHCLEKEKEFIKLVYSKARLEKTQTEVDEVVELMNKYQSIDYAQSFAEQQAKEALDKFDIFAKDFNNQEAVEIIRAGIEFVADRVR
ncbi:MAG: polyprenyl synthetase family protein [Candidatus Komeilibacteria bacterium]|nr:polyprenyl synthetase family protein [Candidatus Komeilibacteria bacterium]